MAVKPDWKLNIPSLALTTVMGGAGCVAAFFLLQGEVKALAHRMERAERSIEKIEVARETDREANRTQRQQDREALLIIQGDIRVVRQMLENMRPSAPPR